MWAFVLGKVFVWCISCDLVWSYVDFLPGAEGSLCDVSFETRYFLTLTDVHSPCTVRSSAAFPHQAKYHDYLQGQIGNPEGATKPNKKYYDPRMSLRAGEEAMAARLVKAAEDLKCIKVL